MPSVKPLSDYFASRYHMWRETDYQVKQAHFQDLDKNGQSPKALVISCCDSRVHVTDIFGADEGELFVHRNIANFVPMAEASDGIHGTAAAIEYAVTALGVCHILVIGHAKCGGVQGCFDLCSGTNEALALPSSFVGRWVREMRPAFERVMAAGKADDIHEMERESVLVSLENLTSYEFVKDAVAQGRLSLHGLWHDIGTGTLHHYVEETGSFEPV
ncbi:MAG: carbonic anhydrase [Candidatus Puniceispirillaceae bacterium]